MFRDSVPSMHLDTLRTCRPLAVRADRRRRLRRRYRVRGPRRLGRVRRCRASDARLGGVARLRASTTMCKPGRCRCSWPGCLRTLPATASSLASIVSGRARPRRAYRLLELTASRRHAAQAVRAWSCSCGGCLAALSLGQARRLRPPRRCPHASPAAWSPSTRCVLGDPLCRRRRSGSVSLPSRGAHLPAAHPGDYGAVIVRARSSPGSLPLRRGCRSSSARPTR